MLFGVDDGVICEVRFLFVSHCDFVVACLCRHAFRTCIPLVCLCVIFVPLQASAKAREYQRESDCMTKIFNTVGISFYEFQQKHNNSRLMAFHGEVWQIQEI